MVDAGFENQKELTKMQLDNQKEIAEMQNETQKEIAGIQSATSRQNTKDQVYAQNEMLAYQQKESTARVASIMENTNLSKQQQVFFFSSRRRHTRLQGDWSSDVCSSDLPVPDRMLVHNEQIVHEYLLWAMCGEPRPKGTFKIYAVEGGTAAMCYTFKSLKSKIGRASCRERV